MLKIFAKNLSYLSRSAGKIAIFANNIVLISLGILCVIYLVFFSRRSVKYTFNLIYPLAFSGVLAWLAFGLTIFVYQNKLLFSPRSLSTASLEALKQNYPSAEEFRITAETGATLQGWLVKKSRTHRLVWQSFLLGKEVKHLDISALLIDLRAFLQFL